jgi:hypothetical protein
MRRQFPFRYESERILLGPLQVDELLIVNTRSFESLCAIRYWPRVERQDSYLVFRDVPGLTGLNAAGSADH